MARERLRVTIEFKKDNSKHVKLYNKIKREELTSDKLIELISFGLSKGSSDDIKKDLQEIKNIIKKGVTVNTSYIESKLDKTDIEEDTEDESIEIDFDFENF